MHEDTDGSHYKHVPEEEISTTVRHWIRDLFPIAMLLVSGLIWGMKLEGRYDTLETRLSHMDKDIATIQQFDAQTRAMLERGILPLTQEKLSMLEAQMKIMREDIKELQHLCVKQ